MPKDSCLTRPLRRLFLNLGDRDLDYFWGSRSFKVNDVNKSKKPVISACYDKQHVCTYPQH